MKKLGFILIFLLLQTILVAQTSVWKIEKNDEVVYLGGTIHLLRAKDYPLPKEYEKAYKASDSIYFETNLQALEEPEIQKIMMSSMMLENGKKLSTILKPETYNALKKHAQTRGINIKYFEKFKPAMIILTLTITELSNMGINTTGVDKFYLLKALKDKKYLGKLESVKSHINYIATMGEGDEDNLVIQSLKDLKQTKKYFNRIISAWRNGSTKTLHKLFVSDLKKYTPKLYQTILVERNNNWIPVIKSLFENDKTEFVLVGVAHLVGRDGLLSQLKKQGYSVQKLR